MQHHTGGLGVKHSVLASEIPVPIPPPPPGRSDEEIKKSFLQCCKNKHQVRGGSFGVERCGTPTLPLRRSLVNPLGVG